MKSIEICGPGFRYSAHVGAGLMARVGELAGAVIEPGRCGIIADDNSATLFGSLVCESLRQRQFVPKLIQLPAGEQSKSLLQVERICLEMAEAGLDRTSFVVGLGGGVIGDLSGFVAAIYHRGIAHIQLPTTLLSMVDSGIGGKTGVNLAAGKNLIGAIHHPGLVIADTATLQSLPRNQLRQGFAEIIKHAIIADREMFDDLSQRADSDLECLKQSSLDVPLEQLITRNMAIKARIVAEDQRDLAGQRALLNFGHTIGHAIERASNFTVLHGDCVSIGMVAACAISVKRAGLTSRERNRVVELLRKFDLPIRWPAEVDRKQTLAAIQRDKKFQQGKIRFVVAPRIGQALVSDDVTINDIRETVESL